MAPIVFIHLVLIAFITTLGHTSISAALLKKESPGEVSN